MSPEQIERAAYAAAHRILAANISASEFACPGARRSRAVDEIAGIIRETFELRISSVVSSRDTKPLLAAEPEPSGPRLVTRRPPGVIRTRIRRAVAYPQTPEAS